MSSKLCGLLVGLSMLCGTAGVLRAADDGQINAAIQKGQSYLLSKMDGLKDGQSSLAAYALLKTGVNKSDQKIQAAVAQAVKEAAEHYSLGKPRYGHEFAYTVPCHMFLLEAADPVAHKESLAQMAGYLAEHQQENGSWFYTDVPVSDASDTSQTQFALLGLWASDRAGVETSGAAWQKAGQWLISTQREDGGYAYQPFAGAKPEAKEVTYSITFSGISSLLVIRQVFYPDSNFGEDIGQMTKPKKKHGVLERMQDEQERLARKGEISITAASFDKAISRTLKNVSARFPSKSHFQTYLFYAMERTAALLDTELIGKHDWYAYASDELVRLQTADGSWSDAAGAAPATSFAILSLSRATAKTLGKPVGKKIGGGLLAGARGLPDDLSKMQLKDGQAIERKSKGDVDDLLAELEKTQDVSVADVQKAILESVNLDNRDQLVGQLDRLRRMAVDPRAEVRRTAFWAMGRSGEIRMSPLLIAGLQDVDVDVIREASYGLTVLSRKPTGLIDDKKKLIPVEPLDGLEEGASDEAQQNHLEQWLALAVPAWKKWYFSIRPYDERDDRQTLQKKR